MQIYPGPFNGVTVRNNRIHHNNTISAAGWGVVVAREPQYTMAGVQIYNNLFYNNGSASVSPEAAGLIVGFGSTGVKVWNNTAYGNKGYGISFDNSGGPSAQDTEFRNNIMWGNLSEGFDDVGINTIKSNNLCSGGQCAPFSSDPLFESPATADFHLQANSPARDQGFDLSGVFTTDYEGQPRVNGFDIGADELSSVDTTPPARPTGLSIE